MGSFRARKVIAIFALLLCSIHARAADTVTLYLGWLPQGSQGGIFVADVQGYYTAENLDVKIVRGYGLLRTVNEIDQGVFEFGVGDATAVLLNRSDGGKTRLIGILGGNPAGLCWIEGRHQITQPSDLQGKTLGLAAGSAGRAMLPVWLKRNGVNPDAIKQLQVEPGVINAALMQGKIDLAECWKGADFAVMEGLARKDGLK